MTVSIEPGAGIDGKYVIERLLGRGGMGAVFVALQEQLQRRVAIKVLLPEIDQSEEAVARFVREARAAAALQSDHVARVLDVGRLPNGSPYTVMELLEGEDLSVLLSRVGSLAPAEAVPLILQTCDAIAEAHAIGIVHRDIKPANIFLARRPNGSVTVKVLDFGISKAATLTGNAALTGSLALMGSPFYMSPEQLREARAVDGRADIWALGVTLYELLTGTTPFAGGALAEICSNILTAAPRSARSLRPEVPPALDAVISRCLEKDPEKRFANVSEFMAALGAAQSDRGRVDTLSADAYDFPSSQRQSAVPSSVSSRSTASALSHTASPSPARRTRSWALSVVGAVVVLGVAAGVARRVLPRSEATSDTTGSAAAAASITAVVPPPEALPPPSLPIVAPLPSVAAPLPEASATPVASARPRVAPTVKAVKAPAATGPAAPTPAPVRAPPTEPAPRPPSNPLDLPFR